MIAEVKPLLSPVIVTPSGTLFVSSKTLPSMEYTPFSVSRIDSPSSKSVATTELASTTVNESLPTLKITSSPTFIDEYSPEIESFDVSL